MDRYCFLRYHLEKLTIKRNKTMREKTVRFLHLSLLPLCAAVLIKPIPMDLALNIVVIINFAVTALLVAYVSLSKVEHWDVEWGAYC